MTVGGGICPLLKVFVIVSGKGHYENPHPCLIHLVDINLGEIILKGFLGSACFIVLQVRKPVLHKYYIVQRVKSS